MRYSLEQSVGTSHALLPQSVIARCCVLIRGYRPLLFLLSFLPILQGFLNRLGRVAHELAYECLNYVILLASTVVLYDLDAELLPKLILKIDGRFHHSFTYVPT